MHVSLRLIKSNVYLELLKSTWNGIPNPFYFPNDAYFWNRLF